MQLNPYGRLILGYNSTTDMPSALFAMNTTNQGFLKPRLTPTQKDAISAPEESLKIYNTITHKTNFYNGTGWRDCADVAAA